MARALQIDLEFKPYRDADKRLARAYELVVRPNQVHAPQGIRDEDVQVQQEEETRNEAGEYICQSIYGSSG